LINLIKLTAGTEDAIVCVAGKANTGKHTLITSLSKYAGKSQDIVG
jgi:hypothetical protein